MFYLSEIDRYSYIYIFIKIQGYTKQEYRARDKGRGILGFIIYVCIYVSVMLAASTIYLLSFPPIPRKGGT